MQSLREMDETTLKDVEAWLAGVAQGEREEAFTGPSFFRPYHFTVLANAVHRAGANRIRIPSQLEGYAARMHLWQAIGLPPPRDVNERNPGGRFFPLSPITSEQSADECAREMREVFRTCGTRDGDTLDAIYIMLTEILGNCFFHSEAQDICGLACAQTWPARNLAQVSVADIGIGIRA